MRDMTYMEGDGFGSRNARYLGMVFAIITSALTFITFGIAILTPPPAGPYCKEGCFSYPYMEMITRFPRDYYWMYPAMVLCLAYIILMASIHHHAPKERKVFTHIGLLLSLVSSAVLFSTYFVQVSVVQQSLINGETEGIALISQYNPHGIFIALEEVGYLLMGLSFAFMAPAFPGRGRLEKAIRWTFISGTVLTALAFIYYSLAYGLYREYRFEVASITIDWLVLIVSGMMIGILFKRILRKGEPG